jgi:hypothetical protein
MGWQFKSRCNYSISRSNGRQFIACPLQQVRTGGFENGTAYTSALHQFTISRVDYGVDLHFCNILSDNGKRHFF